MPARTRIGCSCFCHEHGTNNQGLFGLQSDEHINRKTQEFHRNRILKHDNNSNYFRWRKKNTKNFSGTHVSECEKEAGVDVDPKRFLVFFFFFLRKELPSKYSCVFVNTPKFLCKYLKKHSFFLLKLWLCWSSGGDREPAGPWPPLTSWIYCIFVNEQCELSDDLLLRKQFFNGLALPNQF